MNCPKCNLVLPDKSAFCQYCGCNIEEEIKSQKAELIPDGMRSCPICNRIIRKDSSFCPLCGNKIENYQDVIDVNNDITEDYNKEECSRCQEQVNTDCTVCPSCGYNIEKYNEQKQKTKNVQNGKERHSLIWKIILVVLLMVSLIICVVLNNQVNQYKEKISNLENEITQNSKEINDFKNQAEKDKKQIQSLNENQNNCELYTDLYKILKANKNFGYASEEFYANKSILFLKKNSHEIPIKIKFNYDEGTIYYSVVSGDSNINAEWTEEAWDGYFTELLITPTKRGISEIEISSNIIREKFSIVVVVYD